MRIGARQGPRVWRLKKDSWQTISVHVDSSPTFSTLVSVLWDIKTWAINHHKQHTWTAVALYPANKRGSTQGAEGTSAPNLNHPCYKTGVWPMLYNDLQPPWATYCDRQWDACLWKSFTQYTSMRAMHSLQAQWLSLCHVPHLAQIFSWGETKRKIATKYYLSFGSTQDMF